MSNTMLRARGKKVAPHGGQLHAAGGAVQQLQGQVGFQLLDAPRQRRLGDVQLLGGLVEAPQVGHGHEGLHTVKINFHRVVKVGSDPTRTSISPLARLCTS
jgi:hypothetical protein